MASDVEDIGAEGASSMHTVFTTDEELNHANVVDQTKDIQWGSEDTKLLFEKLNEYLPLVDPMKRFPRKKVMWKQISLDILNTLGCKRTALQCENRYKTIMRRKKNYKYNMTVKKIELDDCPSESIKKSRKKRTREYVSPEYLLEQEGQNDNFFYYYSLDNKNEIHGEQIGKKKSRGIQETMVMIHQMKEESKERRHQEKMDLIRELINVLKN